jgi:hypothetical protein
MTTPQATIPGNVYERAMSVHASVNAAERAIPELHQIARDARRLLNEVRSREGVS